MKGDIYALNCAGCLTTQLVDGGDLEHYQINEDDHLYKTHCPSCKRIMLVPALTFFMNVVHMAPRPPFVPYVPKSAAAAIPEAGPASESASEASKSYIQYLDANSLYGCTMSQKPSRPLATSAWGLSESPSPQQDLDKKLWDEAVVRVNNDLAAMHIKAMNKPYNPVDEDEESESDDELGWGS